MKLETIARGSSRKQKTEIYEHLALISHCDLSGKQLRDLENLDICINLSVLYLNDNLISTLAGLPCSLTRLSLQNNQISDSDWHG
jgi:protein phosphatase 1 regulatory subunit 42